MFEYIEYFFEFGVIVGIGCRGVLSRCVWDFWLVFELVFFGGDFY